MPFYRSPTTLGLIHMKGRKLPSPCSARMVRQGKDAPCMLFSTFLCDGPGQDGRSTCDMPLCDAHATQTGPNKHLCPGCRTAAIDASGQRGLFTHLIQP